MEILIPADITTAWQKRILSCSFSKNKSALIVTINDVHEDDFNPDELITFLVETKIIESLDWKVQNIQDTEGLTYLDDVYTTIELVRD